MSYQGTKVNNNFVGQEINAFIEGGDSIKGKFQTHLDDQVTALIVTVQNSKTVAVVGSTKGKLQKVSQLLAAATFPNMLRDLEQHVMILNF